MLTWYFRTHAWNRIAITGGIVAPVAKEVVGTLTVAHMIALPLGAIAFWALGWTAIGGWRAIERHWRTLTASVEVPAGGCA